MSLPSPTHPGLGNGGTSEEVGQAHMYISREPIGYNTIINTGGIEWGRVDIWIVLRMSFEVI